jgi:hypothetical protein
MALTMLIREFITMVRRNYASNFTSCFDFRTYFMDGFTVITSIMETFMEFTFIN